MFRALQRTGARTPISIAVYEWYRAISHLAQGTQINYRRILTEFIASIGDKPLHRISSANVKQYLQQKLWQLKKSSVNNHLVALKSFFRWASETYKIDNLAEKVKIFKPDPPRQPFITRSQYEAIIASATPQQRDVVQLLAMTGLRASELANLEFDNITENFSAIRFTGKGSRQRTVPLNNTAREIIARHTKAETLFNLPKNRKNVYNLCARAGKSAQVSLSPHTLRRLFATELLHHKKSLLEISFLLGHSSIRTTELYLHIDTSFCSTDCLD